MQTQTMTITPAIAARWLDEYDEWLSRQKFGHRAGPGVTLWRNRKRRDRLAQMYARDMRDGRWQLNGEAIKYAWINGAGRGVDGLDGKLEQVLVDGQHRLLACTMAGLTFETLVVRELGAGAPSSLDNGTPKSLGDLHSMGGDQYSSAVSAAARLLFAEVQTGYPPGRGYNAKGTRRELLELISQHRGLEASAQALHLAFNKSQRRILTPGMGTYFHYRLGLVDPEIRDDFFKRLFTGEGLTIGDPALILRTRMIDNLAARTKLVAPAVMAYVVKSWNAHINGRELRMLKWGEKEGYPKISSGAMNSAIRGRSTLFGVAPSL